MEIYTTKKINLDKIIKYKEKNITNNNFKNSIDDII